MRIFFYTIISSIIFLNFFIPLKIVNASGLDQLQQNLGTVGEKTGLGDSQDADLKARIVDIVNIALGFIGLIAVIFIIYAGFKWMTASGNEEQVTKAKDTIRNAAIGIAVVMLSYVIINFTVTQLQKSTGGKEGPKTTLSSQKSCIYNDAPDCRDECVTIDINSSCAPTLSVPERGCDQNIYGPAELKLMHTTEGRCLKTCPECYHVND